MEDAIRSAQDFLLRSQLPDTGWGYSSFTEQAYPEPTCYSLLALTNTSFSPNKTLSWLSSLVASDGKLYLPGDNMPNWETSILVTTLTKLDQLPEVRASSINWLLEWKGKPTDQSEIVPLNASLIGWSWISDTFSWVQPTSHAVLALKLAGLKTHDRVKEAETLLFDRICVNGGWNFGNPIIYDRPIDPTAMDTAIALFALQDTPNTNELENSLATLIETTSQSPSTLSLALSILCLDVFNRPTETFVDLLLERQESDGSWKQTNWWTALAILALQTTNGGDNVFKL